MTPDQCRLIARALRNIAEQLNKLAAFLEGNADA
jgi:hypothetical protein